MIRPEIHNTLYQFKRIHKKQISHKQPLLSPEIADCIKRKNLSRMNDKEIKSLLKRILKSIQNYQKHRDKPHLGIEKFKEALKEHITK